MATREKKKLADVVKSDAVEAGYRVASHQISRGIKSGIVAMLKDKGMENDKVQAVSDLLDTELGAAVISVTLGYGASFVPQLQGDPRLVKLAEEIRVDGIATAGNFVFSEAFKYLMPAISNALESLPPLPEQTASTRVEVEENNSAEEQLAEDENEVIAETASKRKTMSLPK